MIQSLLLINFQSHKRSELKFCKGLNIITGETDSGKTAIIRALQWLIWNTPSGNAFRSSWADGPTAVKVWGHRTWDNADNDHFEKTLNDKGAHYITDQHVLLKAFGQTIPEEVQKYFNMSEINLQEQLDAPFLLTESPGKIASFFNKIAGLDKIDLSIQYIQSQVRATSSSIKYAENFLQGKQKELEEFQKLNEAEVELKRLEKLELKLIRKKERLRMLKTDVNNLVILEEYIQEKETKIQHEKFVNQILSNIKKRTQLKEQKERLDKFISKLNFFEKSITEYTKTVAPEQIVVNTLQKLTAVTARQADFTQLNTLVSKLQTVTKKQQENALKLDELQHTWEAEFPEQCPLCDTIIKKK